MLFREAISHHRQYAACAADRQGIDRHLFGLEKLFKDGEPVPATYTDEAFGKINQWELSTSQLFHMRPVPGYTDFRTPVRGLYQASSATHGGGGVTGIPGLNAVRAILADHSRRSWA